MLKIKKFSNKFLLYFFVLFLLTLGSEILSNIIIIALFFYYYKDVKFSKRELIPTVFFLLILLPFYFFSNNEYILRFIIYIPRFLLILIIFERFLLCTSYDFIRRISFVVFTIHCIVILMCAMYPPLNVFLNFILSKPFVSEFRISGLFSGYDFISFFTVLYLYGEYRCNEYKFNFSGYLQLLLGFSATLVSGRFGIIMYLIFFAFIFFKKITFSKITSLIVIGSIMVVLFYERILLFYNTFLLLKDTLQLDDPNNSKLSLEDYGSEKQDGVYQLSPLTLFDEATRPFKNISNYIFPNFTPNVVDSGPSFVILNIGFILFIGLYLYYFKLLYKEMNGIIFITFLILVMDIKFRILLVMMPTIWIVLNLSRIKKYEENNI